MNNYENFLTYIINKYGIQQQDIVCIEELSELQKELTKSLRGKENRQNIIEEIAHCYISIDMIKKTHNISMNEIDKEIKKKINEYKK
jgi:hypothetical protein